MKFLITPYKPIIVNALLVSLLLLIALNQLETNKNLGRLVQYSNIDQNKVLLERTEDEKYKILRRLSTQVQIDYFNRLLGSPLYINWSQDSTLKEYIYVDMSYYVQAITDTHDKVLAYAVTSRSMNFTPSLQVPNSGAVKMNHTSFKEIRSQLQQPQVCYLFLGNTAPTYYFEQYYLGNASLYQTYLFGVNDAGELKLDLPLIDEGEYNLSERNTISCDAISERALEKSTPNTYMVSSEIEPKEIPFSFGINRIQVRTLNE